MWAERAYLLLCLAVLPFLTGVTVSAAVHGETSFDAERAAERKAEIAQAKAETVREIYAQQAKYFAMDTDAAPEWNGDTGAGPVHCWNGTACPDFKGD